MSNSWLLLHNWQIDSMNEDLVEAFLARNGGMPMTDSEIDELCERLSIAREQVVKGAAY